jgi:hypothetical protein
MKADVRKELDAILAERGALTPQAVLERARNEESPLHACFTWDDTEAAEQWRLTEARRLIIKVKVEVQARANEPPIRVRAYTSLLSDRIGGGGYQSTVAVMSDATQRAEVLRTALAELQALQRKYRHLSELSMVMQEIDRVAAQHAVQESLDQTG